LLEFFSIADIFFCNGFFMKFISQNKCTIVPNSESYDLLLYILLYVTNVIAVPELPEPGIAHLGGLRFNFHLLAAHST